MFKFFSRHTKKESDKKNLSFKFSIGQKIKNFFLKEQKENFLEPLEELFFEADLGVETTITLIEKLKEQIKKNPSLSQEDLFSFIKKKLIDYFPSIEEIPLSPSPHIILIVGVNGSGKTTTLAKLAHFLQKIGKKTLLVAADTYRAAAMEQLALWAKKINADIIKSQPNSDPSSVVFDALMAAKKRRTDIVLIDTAGRLHTKTDLMQELEKIRRVCNKLIPDAPHETLLVVDATTGQNAIDQAEIFHNFTPLSGIVLTKLDGTAKGGIVVALQKKLGIPVRWVGIGEKIDDFLSFNSEWFIKTLLAEKK